MRCLRLAAVSMAVAMASSVLAVQVGYWSFSEGGGTTVADGSGFGNSGTIMNLAGSTWIAGKAGGAIYFDGTLGPSCTRVEIADSPSLRLTTASSYAAWVRSDDVNRDAPILAKEGPGGKLSYWFGTFGPSGAGHWGILQDADGNQAWDYYGRDQGSVPLGVWTHLAVTWSGTQAKYYMNGTLTNTLSWSGVIHASDAPLFFGSNSLYTFEPNRTAFKGAIDEVHLFDHALTSDEVALLAAVPEPATLLAVAFGALGLARRKKR